jgi:hypothetical protein
MLLAVMCLERYAAVARPLVYLRARKWGYKIAISAAVWTVTLIFVMTTGEDVYGSHTRDVVGSNMTSSETSIMSSFAFLRLPYVH